MSLAGLGYFAGGVSDGYMRASKNKREQQAVDSSIELAKSKDAREQRAADAEYNSNVDLGKQLQKLGYTSLGQFLAGQAPQAAAAPAAPALTPDDTSVPGLAPAGPQSGLTPLAPYAANRPTFGSR